MARQLVTVLSVRVFFRKKKQKKEYPHWRRNPGTTTGIYNVYNHSISNSNVIFRFIFFRKRYPHSQHICGVTAYKRKTIAKMIGERSWKVHGGIHATGFERVGLGPAARRGIHKYTWTIDVT